jgi:hypothetical protein
MQMLLLDLWNDLRAKRLWPVAALLLAALVATPVVLSTDAEEPAPPAPPPAQGDRRSDGPKGPAALAKVELGELAEGTGSSLSAFDSGDPFALPEEVLEAARASQDGGSPVPGDVGPGGGSGPTDSGSIGGGGGGGAEPPTGTPAPGTGDPDAPGDTSPETTEYAYVLDVTFWSGDRKRTIEGLEKLDMLPNEASPLLIFLGVTDNAGNGVFLVDSTLQAAGEGTCKPNGDECAFLYLGAGSEHQFTNDEGDSYRLRIDEIRKVRVDARASTARTDEGASAGAAVAPPASTRRFVMPVLADLVRLSSGGSDDSTSYRDRR